MRELRILCVLFFALSEGTAHAEWKASEGFERQDSKLVLNASQPGEHWLHNEISPKGGVCLGFAVELGFKPSSSNRFGVLCTTDNGELVQLELGKNGNGEGLELQYSDGDKLVVRELLKGFFDASESSLSILFSIKGDSLRISLATQGVREAFSIALASEDQFDVGVFFRVTSSNLKAAKLLEWRAGDGCFGMPKLRCQAFDVFKQSCSWQVGDVLHADVAQLKFVGNSNELDLINDSSFSFPYRFGWNQISVELGLVNDFGDSTEVFIDSLFYVFQRGELEVTEMLLNPAGVFESAYKSSLFELQANSDFEGRLNGVEIEIDDEVFPVQGRFEGISVYNFGTCLLYSNESHLLEKQLGQYFVLEEGFKEVRLKQWGRVVDRFYFDWSELGKGFKTEGGYSVERKAPCCVRKGEWSFSCGNQSNTLFKRNACEVDTAVEERGGELYCMQGGEFVFKEEEFFYWNNDTGQALLWFEDGDRLPVNELNRKGDFKLWEEESDFCQSRNVRLFNTPIQAVKRASLACVSICYLDSSAVILGLKNVAGVTLCLTNLRLGLYRGEELLDVVPMEVCPGLVISDSLFYLGVGDEGTLSSFVKGGVFYGYSPSEYEGGDGLHVMDEFGQRLISVDFNKVQCCSGVCCKKIDGVGLSGSVCKDDGSSFGFSMSKKVLDSALGDRCFIRLNVSEEDWSLLFRSYSDDGIPIQVGEQYDLLKGNNRFELTLRSLVKGVNVLQFYLMHPDKKTRVITRNVSVF